MKKHLITFIINPVSGLGKYKTVEKMLERFLDTKLYDYSIEYIVPNQNIEDLARKAVSNGCDIVVAVGGDGSVNAVANGIIGSNVAVGIIPVGSGNGLANFLKIPKQIRGAIEVLNKCNIIKIDTIFANDKRIVSIAELGYDALVAEKMKKSPIRGLIAYMHIAIQEFIRYRPKTYQIKCNGECIKTRALFIAFANSNQFGYNFPIISNASLTDGLMHLCIVEKPPLALISWVGFNLFFHHKENATKFIKIIPTSEAVVEQRWARIMNIDGEAVKMPKEIEFKIDPLSLNILVP